MFAAVRSVVVADFDHDGDLDVAVANYATQELDLLKGRGDGTLGAPSTYSAGFGPLAVVSGDFNGDLAPDAAIANDPGGNIWILLNEGRGRQERSR